MYQFLIAAVTNYHKSSGLRQNKCIILQFYSSEMGVTGLKSGVGRATFLLEALEKDVFACLFQLLEATSIPWLVAPSSIFKASNGRSSLHTAISPVLSSVSLFPLIRTLVTILGPLE